MRSNHANIGYNISSNYYIYIYIYIYIIYISLDIVDYV